MNPVLLSLRFSIYDPGGTTQRYQEEERESVECAYHALGKRETQAVVLSYMYSCYIIGQNPSQEQYNQAAGSHPLGALGPK